MIVRACWRSCDYEWKQEKAEPVDAFWVEATYEEAVRSVFPMLSEELQSQSKRLGAQGERNAGEISELPRPFCFLVSPDLSVIEPHAVHFPFHNLWNGYSPFRSIPERTIRSLDELAGLPAKSPGEGHRSS